MSTHPDSPHAGDGASFAVDMSNGGHDTTTKVTGRAATQGACPFRGTRVGGAIGSKPTLTDWYPDRLRIELLHQDPVQSNPLADVDYTAAFLSLDLDAVKADLRELMTSSVDWWPSDYGNYGPQMIRMAWHSAGTYRIADGRGGSGNSMLRFAPLNSWWDNGNIDKSRRLIWPIKQKYGASLSWADLMILTGNVALEVMGFPTFGFAGGRTDSWEADRITYWGPESWVEGTSQPARQVTMDKRWRGGPDQEVWDLENPVAASHQALIYVNPEGPGGNGNPMDSAREIRESFARMAMNDEETVALIAGGHAFGKSHGMVPADQVGPEPESAPMSAQGMGWLNPVGTGNAEFTSTNGIEGSWTPNPTQWDNDYLTNLFGFEWEKTTSPAGAEQWTPIDPDAPKTPDAHIPGKMDALMMTTADIALRTDPAYREVCQRFLDDFDYFTDAFSRAWYKLTHRDMGPVDRYLGKEVPDVVLPWQDPIPALDHPVVDEADIAALKQTILDSGATVPALVSAAWASASTFRGTDKRGGANGARVRLAPQKDWVMNNPDQLAETLSTLEAVQADFQKDGKRVSMADLIVLGGAAAVEKAAKRRRRGRDRPVRPGPHGHDGRVDRRRELRVAQACRGRLPQLRQRRGGVQRRAGAPVPGPRLATEPDRARVGRALGRPQGPRHQRRRHPARRLHRPPRRADERLLPRPDVDGLRVDAAERPGGDVRHRGSRVGRDPVHGDALRPGLRCQLGAAPHLGGLRRRRRAPTAGEGLRQGVAQGHDARPLRRAGGSGGRRRGLLALAACFQTPPASVRPGAGGVRSGRWRPPPAQSASAARAAGRMRSVQAA